MRRVQILSEVSLSVAGGEIVGILGPRDDEEGATVLQVAAGLVQPDTGQIRLDGIDVTRLSKARREELRSRHILWVDSQLPMPKMISNVHGYVRLRLLLGHGSVYARQPKGRSSDWSSWVPRIWPELVWSG